MIKTSFSPVEGRWLGLAEAQGKIARDGGGEETSVENAPRRESRLASYKRMRCSSRRISLPEGLISLIQKF